MIHIIIPCYNMAKYVGETIDSVKAQDRRNAWDCIIVDDGSFDNSGNIIGMMTEGDSRFRVIHTKNHGVAAARNRAIEEAGGGYILPLDADDRLMPGAISKFAAAWKERPDASLLVPQIVRFDARGVRSVQERKWEGYEDLKERCTPTNSSCFRWIDWKRVGGYRSWTMYEDWEFWLRLLHYNDRVVNIPHPLVEYRIHKDSRWHKAVQNHVIEVELIKSMNPEIFNK